MAVNQTLAALFVVASTLSSASGMIINKRGVPYSGHQIYSSTTAGALKSTNQPLYDAGDEEAFRSLYQERSSEGVSLGKEFDERQVQLEKDRKKLAETFNLDAAVNSASLFNTANRVVMSTPSIRRARSSVARRTQTSTPPVNEDNWALILCMSLTAQLSQQAAVLQDFYPPQLLQQQQLQMQQTAVIFVCALALVFASSSSGYLEIPTAHSQITSLNSFPH